MYFETEANVFVKPIRNNVKKHSFQNRLSFDFKACVSLRKSVALTKTKTHQEKKKSKKMVTVMGFRFL